ncbi:MAG: hypothetical protein IJO56_00745 [Oscillospiraceae bacterium]|nr:hypothetical protein [Oscillospiraceae bacterium]
MKTLKTLGSTKFWMILSAMLMVFVLFAGVLLIVMNPLKATEPTQNVTPSSVVQQQQPSQDTGFDATKDRVNQVNGNYGQSVKDSYTGDSSTMESMMRQRMFFSGLKSIMIIILLGVVIAVVIVKALKPALAKKKAGDVDAGESEISEEEHRSTPAKKRTQSPKKKTTSTQKPEKKIDQDNKTEEKPARDADEQEVADTCQLP